VTDLLLDGRIKKNLNKKLVASSGKLVLASKVFHDCSGGNSRPSRLSGVGGGNFL
jgi:hypothetical protein